MLGYLSLLFRLEKALKEAEALSPELDWGARARELSRINSSVRGRLRWSLIGYCLVLPLLVSLITVLMDGYQHEEAQFRIALGWMFTPLNSIFGIASGLGYGLLALPTWFLDSPAGDSWKKLAGTTSTRLARFVARVLCWSAAGYAALVIVVSRHTG